MPGNSTSEVKIARSPEEKARVFQSRYQIYSDLWKKAPAFGNSESRTIEDELDASATHLYIERDGSIVSSVRLNWLHKTQLSTRYHDVYGLTRFFARFPPEALTISSQLFVAERWRDSEILGKLLGFAYTLCRESEVQFDFRLCASSFTSFYEVLGYRRYKEVVRLEAGEHHVPMVCVLEDVGYFRRVDSPLYQLAARFENHIEAAEWFEENVVGADSLTPAATDVLVGEEAELELATLSSGMDAHIPLFKGLDEFEIKQFTEPAKVIEFKKGETIVKAGYTGNEMFVVLKGSLEARGEQNGVTVSLGTFGLGEVFGEISFLMQRRRTADVVGITDGKLLEISQIFLDDAMAKLPFLTMRVLMNLSVILCERLCSTTVQLLIANSK